MNVKMVSQNILYDHRVQKAMRRMRAMGLKVSLIPEGDYDAYIFIDLESLKKLISENIKYPNKELYIEDKYMVIHVWRSK